MDKKDEPGFFFKTRCLPRHPDFLGPPPGGVLPRAGTFRVFLIFFQIGPKIFHFGTPPRGPKIKKEAWDERQCLLVLGNGGRILGRQVLMRR